MSTIINNTDDYHEKDNERGNQQQAFQPVINVDARTSVDSNAHVWRVLGTVLAVAAFCSIAWGLGQAGLLDLASALATAFLFQFLQLLFGNGIIVLPESKSSDARIEDGKSALRALIDAGKAIIENSSILRLALIAMLYALAFVAVRYIITIGLGVFSNVFIAAGFGALLAAVICAPTLFASIFRAMKSKGGARK